MTVRGRLTIIATVVFLLQVSLFNDLRVAGVAAEVPLLVTILVTFASRVELGAIVGFSLGVLLDIVTVTPLGLTAATYVLVAAGVGSFKTGLGEISWIGRAVGVFVATALGLGLFAFVGEMMGQDYASFGRLLRVMAVGGAWNVVLALPFGAAAGWAVGADEATAERHLRVVE